jgi:cysteine desulfurase / selenocysteine lyase
MRAAEGTAAPGRREEARFDVERVRRDFPILDQKVRNHPLVYLDNAATSQKPLAVIEAVSRYYLHDNANIHRGVHELSQRATRDYEEARAKIQRFINAGSDREIVFTGGTTGAINLVAQSYGRSHVREGDEIVLTTMEHHSNIVPWQILAEEKGARLKIAPVDERGELILEELEKLLGPRTRIVSLVHLSNSLGTLNPVQEVIRMAHARSIPVLLDGAQAAAHLRIDVQELDCDFYAFSGHKMYGPTGIGILYGKEKLLDAMPPYQSGGDMISSVSFEKTHYNRLPFKFEAGTPNIAAVIGLSAAIDYLEEIGVEAAAAHENDLLAYATEAISKLPKVRILGTARKKAGILSFLVDGVHPHDIGTILDEQGVAIRAGHHCTQPLMERFGVPATARASFAMYNTRQDVDALAAGIRKVLEVFG